MIFPPTAPTVLDLAGSKIRVTSNDATHQAALMNLGFIAQGDQLVCPVADDAHRKSIAQALVNMNAVFSEGRDWSPAELMALYREQGVINTPYRVISWTDPQHYVISQRG
ncbi:MAG: hypothetical protein RIS44_1047 [Pseudomonadota bacterium]